MIPWLRWLSLFGALWLVLLSGASGCSCGDDEDTSSSGATGGSGGAITSTGGAGGGSSGEAELLLLIGDDVGPSVAERVTAHVESASDLPVRVESGLASVDGLHPDSRVLGIGDTTASRALVEEAELDALGSEGFVVRSGELGEVSALVAVGNALEPDPYGHPNLGTGFAAYSALEVLGFGFLHPLEPVVPATLQWPTDPVDLAENPHWPVRTVHLHTMHPLELTHVLQGWGPLGPDDEAGWQSLVPEWESFLEWMLANRQNRVTWALLRAQSWDDFAESAERQARLTELVRRAHDYGVLVGIDAPIVLHQQHSFQLITDLGDLTDELTQLHDRVDYLMATGLDFLKTESGTSEFTSPDGDRMLAWMDELAAYLDQQYGTEAYIKVHCSTGQTVANYPDPITGDPINFNFLPHYADPRLGILPHTVQHYSLSDPAPTYGNTDFAYMRDFLQQQVGRRPVVFYPETAYWVSFDIDVPLFLPVYAHRRLEDLRVLAEAEIAGEMGLGQHAGKRMDGQLIFSSGWEWGYWLGDVVTARAAWNPRVETASDETAMREALAPVTRHFGEAAEPTTDLLIDVMQMQLDVMIRGEVNGVSPSTVVRRNGQAYLQGSEPWDDVADLAGGLGLHPTQPDKLGLVEMRNPLHAPPGYSAEVEPLLAEMETRFALMSAELEALRPLVPEEGLPLFDDLLASLQITALRATQVHNLYDYVDGTFDQSEAWKAQRLQTAQDALDEALALVQAREAHYRADPERIAGWGNNPTAYEYGYLWTVRSLYFWWRDEGKAVEIPISPCYRNIINPVDVGFGEGLGYDAADLLGQLFATVPGIGSIAECLTVPQGEPMYAH